MCCSRKYSFPSHRGFFGVSSPPPNSSGNSSFGFILSFKNLAFEMPLPLGISKNTPWSRYGFFLEPNNWLSLSDRNLEIFCYLLKRLSYFVGGQVKHLAKKHYQPKTNQGKLQVTAIVNLKTYVSIV